MTATAARNCRSGQNSDPNAFAQGEARDLDRASVEPAAVGGEQLEQPVLNDDGEAEGDQERRQEIIAEGAIEEQALQRVADRRHDRCHDDNRGQRIEPERVGRHQRDIGRKHDQIAMRDVDEPHHPEDQRQPRGEHRIEPPDQDPLDEDV